jgi:hypothetical protein
VDLNLETKNPGIVGESEKQERRKYSFPGFQIGSSSFPAFLIELLSA